MTLHEKSAQQPVPAGRRSLWERFKAGGWYYVVVLASAGILAPIPMWHAWTRLRTRYLLIMASTYTAVAILLVYVLPSSSERAADGQPASNVGGLAAVALMISACFLLVRPRREVFGLGQPVAYHEDPAVQRALDGRARRDRARAIVESDQPLARELRIGRPDLPRDYDDGGLVDVNSAPAHVVADVCGIDARWGEEIVAARELRCGGFFHIAELLIEVQMPGHVGERIRDRGVCIA
ncbi:hypothetical protein IN07_16520 [Modestobacter caceresii]|uniref:Uncharacterized protein n=1 Tax=Modestobacter caceresii TaxID=1522368 RepID=A0A098Y5H8_9ACTN|nr:hypothetical protein [Modestobacter caceresii]KGH45685.1 hypothetical protein IN07_16520 [Modestobacter caceresii]